MSNSHSLASQPKRLSPQAGEVIDRSQTVKFKFDGKEYTAHPGDTIASALAAAGVNVISRSFKYHRPRGLLCCSGHCPNCLVQVGDEPNVRACTTDVQEGMAVTHQNAFPSLGLDVMSATQLVDPFLPVGFYYKTFVQPRQFWPLYEEVLRHVAGLGEVHAHTEHGQYSKQYLHADVVVVGGGPAGVSAALAAARRGARVLLFDDNARLGGHSRYNQVDINLSPLMAEVMAHPQIGVYTNTTVLGYYEHDWLAAVSGSRLYKVRARAIVVATGAYERPLVFDDNDLPGVMLAGGVQRLLKLYGVAPGRRAVVVSANDDGWRVAADLHAAGVAVQAVVEERTAGSVTNAHVQMLRNANVPLFFGHTIQRATGWGRVSGAVIAPVLSDEAIDGSAARSINCDLIAVSVGWTPVVDLVYQAGGKTAYHDLAAEILPSELPHGVFVAGRAAGVHYSLTAQLQQGEAAGQDAAHFVGLGDAPAPATVATDRRTSPRLHVPGNKKQFICYCEDVTHKDLKVAIEEGYDNIELLKRYSTISMGPCQGKMCSMSTVRLCAAANGKTVQETGTTTSRPPAMPVSLGALAGQHMEPVQLSPLHEWHVAHGGKKMVAGTWLRVERYADVAQEVKAVRERVGLIDVSTLGKLRLSGDGVPALLDRLYINQWRGLPVGRVRYGVMCNDEGVVLDDGVTAHVGEQEWYMTTTTSGSSAIFEWIQWWAQSGWGEGVLVSNVSESYAAVNLAGPMSRATLQKLTSLDISNEAFPYMHVRHAEVAGVPCRILRIGFTGELSYEIHCLAGYALQLWEALLEAGSEFSISPFGIEAQRILRLEKAHIIVSQDTDAVTDPYSADMGWAVKLDKPDFLGKRSLTRVAAKGVSHRLVGFKMARPDVVPDEGLQIVANDSGGRLNTIGYISSCRYSPTLEQTIGLCWLPAEVAQNAGATIRVRMSASRLEDAQVHHGAFYDADGARLRS